MPQTEYNIPGFLKGLHDFLTLKTLSRFLKSACLENSKLTALSLESLSTTLLFIYERASSSLKGLSTLCGSYNILTLSGDINLSKYFCLSVYFLLEVFIFC